MFDPQLWLFCAAVLGIVLLPGLDMAFVAASALAGGRRLGLWAVAGLVAGAACHVTASGLGIATVIVAHPGVFQAMLLAGAGYMAWIGVALWRAPGTVERPRAVAASTVRGTFLRAIVTSLLNPKAYLFMLSAFPQFVRADRAIAPQVAKLGAIIAVIVTLVYGAIAILFGATRTWLGSRPGVVRCVQRCAAAVLIVLAVLAAIRGLGPQVRVLADP